jgi:hypothetical protein
MSKLMLLAAVSLAVTAIAPVASAQASRPGSTVTVSPVRGGVTATPGRPTVVDRVPIRPHRRGDDDRDGNLRERLRNACFNDPNPPVPLCRRVFGNHGAGGRPAG